MQSSEFKYNKQLFTEKARKWTQEHAVQKNMVSLSGLGEEVVTYLMLFMIEIIIQLNLFHYTLSSCVCSIILSG